MEIAKRLKALDRFGAPLSLNFGGDASHRTAGGGLASLLLNFVILGYFIKQMLQLVNYEDPVISSYKVFEDRSKMTESMSFEDFNFRFYATFFSTSTGRSVPLDPRIGRFRLTKAETNFLKYGTWTAVTEEVELVSFGLEDGVNQHMLTPSDLSKLELRNSFGNPDKIEVKLEFLQCTYSPTCSSESQIREFLKAHYVNISSQSNYIDYEKVTDVEDSLQDFSDLLIWEMVDLDEPAYFSIALEEYRVQLHD